MKFFREKLIHREANGITAAGYSATKVVVDQTPRDEIILGNGSSTFNTYDPYNPAVPPVAMVTVPLTTGFDGSRHIVNLSGNGQLFVTVQVIALGTVTNGVDVLIEFLDPDHSLADQVKIWLPSKEGEARTAVAADCIWGPLAAGSYILASREEPLHFTQARVSFKANAGAANAATRIHVGWFHDGALPYRAEQ